MYSCAHQFFLEKVTLSPVKNKQCHIEKIYFHQNGLFDQSVSGRTSSLLTALYKQAPVAPHPARPPRSVKQHFIQQPYAAQRNNTLFYFIFVRFLELFLPQPVSKISLKSICIL